MRVREEVKSVLPDPGKLDSSFGLVTALPLRAPSPPTRVTGRGQAGPSPSSLPSGLWSRWDLPGMSSWLLGQGWGEVGGTGAKQITRMDESEPFPKAFRHGTNDPAPPLMEELASESEKKLPEQALKRGRKLPRQMSCE